MKKEMNSTEFRKQLKKIMPGYKWTVHRPLVFLTPLNTKSICRIATGIQSSGSNRLSTLFVRRTDKDSVVEYEVKSAGYGRNAPWLLANTGGTLARALRGLQEHYEAMAMTYSGHAGALRGGRKEKGYL